LQRARLAAEDAAAALLEQAGVGLHHCARVGDAYGIGHQHTALHRVFQMRLERSHGGAVEWLEVDAVDLAVGGILGERGVERLGRAVDAQIAGAAYDGRDAGRLHQRLVLDDAALHQRPHRLRGGRHMRRRRGPPVMVEPGRDPGQRRPVQVGLGQLVEGVLEEQHRVAREGVGHHALALDDAGVAIAGLLAGPAPVDERHGASALLEMESSRDAGNTGPQHNHVGANHMPCIARTAVRCSC
jgi:hypothetical protein